MVADEGTLDEILIGQAEAIIALGLLHMLEHGPTPALKSAYVSGIWLGLSIGITDVVAARRVRKAITDVIAHQVGTDEEGQTAVDQLVRAAHAASKT